MVARAIVVRNNFQERFGHFTDQISHLKAENKWERFRILDCEQTGFRVALFILRSVISATDKIARVASFFERFFDCLFV